MPDAFHPIGTEVTYNSIAVNGIQDITIGAATRGEAESTANDTGLTRKFVTGLIDAGTLTLNCRFRADDPGQVAMRDDFATNDCAAAEGVEVVITLPDCATDDSTVATITMDAWVQEVGEISLTQDADEVAMQNFSLRIVSFPQLSSV